MTRHINPVFLVLLACAAAAHAQEPTNQPAATQPGAGRLELLQRARFTRYVDDARRIDETTYETIVGYGLAPDLAVMAHVPVTHRDVDGPLGASSTDVGVGDIMVMAQWRFLRLDTGPIDTTRAALSAGLELPTFDEGYSSDSVDPFVGLAMTHIRGRHGIGMSGRYKLNTGSRGDPFAGGDGDADAFFYDAAYLYRLTPARYRADTPGSLYFQMELNGLYETNGDHELLASPGLLYEARGWAAEVSVQLPAVEHVDERPEIDFAVVFGFRLLF